MDGGARDARPLSHARRNTDRPSGEPPYNTGARDWKYNNDYVEGDDDYRHSKWLAFMERRLEIAKELLNPEDSVLIVTIDEKEYARLAILLEQIFPEARIQMVSVLINPKGSSRMGQFARSDEYLFFVTFGDAAPAPQVLSPEWQGTRATTTGQIRWVSMIRSGTGVARQDRPGMFYPILLDAVNGSFAGIGSALAPSADRSQYSAPAGTVAVWPMRADGTEGRWQVGPETAKSLRAAGFLRVGRFQGSGTAISYLKSGEQQKVLDGVFGEATRNEAGHVEVAGESTGVTRRVPTTQWALSGHSASEHGTRLLSLILPARRFPFPKSLYAVEDSLGFFVANKPHATVLDFFSGSGTTAHAVMRLNKQDGGHRLCISVTNNEVSAEEQVELRKQGLRPGDQDWEQWGICDYITKPRVTAAITGKTPEGAPVKGHYKFTDEFPMADGFEQNAAFFTLTYESPLAVRHHRAFERIAPMLWLRAGSRGRIITNLGEDGWDVAEAYGVIESIDQMSDFVARVEDVETVETVFIVTDSDAAFQAACRDLPERVTAVRLYESYLHNFTINRRSGA